VSASAEPVGAQAEGLSVAPRRGLRGNAFLAALRGNRQAVFGGTVLAIVVLIAVLAPWIAPYGEHERVGEVFAPPSSQHWLGLDDGGFDMLSLMMYGARVSLIVGFAAAVVAMLIGGVIGVLAGYFGGRSDTALMRITDYFLAIPDLPLMIVVAAIWGRGLNNIILIIGIIYWTTTARVVRAQVKSIRERGYIRRTRVLGASDSRLILRHVLPQVAPLLVATAVIMVAYAIFAETAIAFLGLGDPSATSWGLLIENAFSRDAISVGAWWAIVPPGIAVAIVVVSLTMLGTAIEDVLNPRLRVSHLSVRRFRMRPAPPGEDSA
jgi:peptide/nickel transport system permease protein